MATNAPLRFLDLPGELRNHIYRQALITPEKDDPITVTSTGYARSGLLQTCKQVHAEAFRIHQLESSFESKFVNFNIIPAMTFIEKFIASKASGALHKDDIIDFTITCEYLESTSDEDFNKPTIWENLIEWLRCVHDGKDLIHTFVNGEDRGFELRNILDSMFQTAVDSREVPWEQLERKFERIRTYIERVDKTFEGSLMGFSAEAEDEE